MIAGSKYQSEGDIKKVPKKNLSLSSVSPAFSRYFYVVWLCYCGYHLPSPAGRVHRKYGPSNPKHPKIACESREKKQW